MTISIFGHRHPLMWVDQSESWFPAKHAHVRRHQTQHILCQQRLSYLRSTSNYFLVVAWFFYFFIEKADFFFSKIQTFWRKRRPYLCVFFKKVLFADQSPLKRTQLVSLHVLTPPSVQMRRRRNLQRGFLCWGGPSGSRDLAKKSPTHSRPHSQYRQWTRRQQVR